MNYLLDTNVLVRLANIRDASHAVAVRAVTGLHGRGDLLRITAQNLVEFRGVATRPKSSNGLGHTPQDAEAKAADFEGLFPLLPETPGIFPAWKALVEEAAVVGKQVHDARLVAVCYDHELTQLLTFNVRHFSRLAASGSQSFVNLAEAKEIFPDPDPDRNTERFTWAITGGDEPTRFESWKAYGVLST